MAVLADFIAQERCFGVQCLDGIVIFQQVNSSMETISEMVVAQVNLTMASGPWWVPRWYDVVASKGIGTRMISASSLLTGSPKSGGLETMALLLGARKSGGRVVLTDSEKRPEHCNRISK